MDLNILKYFDPSNAMARGREEARAIEKARIDNFLTQMQALAQQQNTRSRQEADSIARTKLPYELADASAITEGRSLSNRKAREELDAIPQGYRTRELMRKERDEESKLRKAFIEQTPAYSAIAGSLDPTARIPFMQDMYKQAGLPEPRTQGMQPADIPHVFGQMSQQQQDLSRYGEAQMKKAEYEHKASEGQLNRESAERIARGNNAATIAAAKSNQVPIELLEDPDKAIAVLTSRGRGENFGYLLGSYQYEALKKQREDLEKQTGQKIPPTEQEQKWGRIANESATVLNAKTRYEDTNIPGLPNIVDRAKVPTRGATGSFDDPLRGIPKEIVETAAKRGITDPAKVKALYDKYLQTQRPK